MENQTLTFGPVPSRRLGQSLGINHIPPKTCTYACVYCQVGRTSHMTLRRQVFFPTDQIVESVQAKLEELQRTGRKIDYLTFVPDGEPTLDLQLGRHIQALQKFKIPIAVITNTSLLPDPDVQEALHRADWVSLKVDAVEETLWRRIDRPHGKLRLESILEAAQVFRRRFPGRLVTETMLVQGENDEDQALEQLAEWIRLLQPDLAYLSAPTRPPAEAWVRPPAEERLCAAFAIFQRHGLPVELLISYEGNEFVSTGQPEEDLLNILAVHPMREEAVQSFLSRTRMKEATLDRLIQLGLTQWTTYGGRRFLVRRFPAPNLQKGKDKASAKFLPPKG